MFLHNKVTFFVQVSVSVQVNAAVTAPCWLISASGVLGRLIFGGTQATFRLD